MVDNFIRVITIYIPLTWAMTKSSILSAMEYRASFLIQVMGMIVNDIGLILVWVIFFKKFPSVYGWGFNDTIVLFSLTTIAFSLLMIFARGIMDFGKIITQGELDYFLSFPKNVVWHVAVSKTEISAVGDLLFGIVIYFFANNTSFVEFSLIILMALITALIFFNFIAITQSITFFAGSFEDAAEQMWHVLLGFTLYPQTAFHGALKIIMFTILPAFFIATLPVQLVRDFNPLLFLGLLLFWLATFILMIFIFKKGLKKYESGNLINVKM